MPKITLVTPSFNQGSYLAQTIESVIGQRYEHLEYFVVDGGSADDSLDVIREYSNQITWHVSEADTGQAAALIKGFSRATGDVMGWINSDDLLEPGALEAVGRAYRQNPGTVIAGNVMLFADPSGRNRLLRPRNLNFQDMVEIWTGKSFFSQPGVFFPRRAYEEVGGLDVNLHYCMDQDLITRLVRVCPVVYINEVLARARQHRASKTCSQSGRMVVESCVVARRYLKESPGGENCLSRCFLAAYFLRRVAGRFYHGELAAAWFLLKHFLR